MQLPVHTICLPFAKVCRCLFGISFVQYMRMIMTLSWWKEQVQKTQWCITTPQSDRAVAEPTRRWLTCLPGCELRLARLVSSEAPPPEKRESPNLKQGTTGKGWQSWQGWNNTNFANMEEKWDIAKAKEWCTCYLWETHSTSNQHLCTANSSIPFAAICRFHEFQETAEFVVTWQSSISFQAGAAPQSACSAEGKMFTLVNLYKWDIGMT